MKLQNKLSLLNLSHIQWSEIGASLIWYFGHHTYLNHVCCFKWRQNWTAIDWLPRHLLSNDHHVIIMWSFGLTRAQLTFCGYCHVSMSSSLMLVAATSRSWCFQVVYWSLCIRAKPFIAKLVILPSPCLWCDVCHQCAFSCFVIIMISLNSSRYRWQLSAMLTMRERKA